MKRILWLSLGLAALLLAPGRSAADEARYSLDYKSARVEDVLRALTLQAGLGMVSSGTLEGTVTLRLKDVTFDEAMRHVADATGIAYARKGNVLTVNPKNVEARTFQLHYVSAASARDAVARLLSPQGTVDVFNGAAKDDAGKSVGMGAGNTLMVRDNESRLEEVARVLATLDRKPRLVSIEARLVEVTLNNDEKMGLDWHIGASISGAAVPMTFPFDKHNTGGSFTPTPNTNAATGGSGPTFPAGQMFPYAQAGDFTFGRLSAAEFKVALDFLSSRTNTNLVSTPKIATLENVPATILIGQVIPIALYQNSLQTGALQLSGYDEKQVGMRLAVNPRVCADGGILMTVHPEISEIVEWRGQYNERPVTSTREASTEVIVRDGETVVIGGLVRELVTEQTSRVPLLGSIPVLGELFKHHYNSKQKVDLVVFVTPHLLPE